MKIALVAPSPVPFTMGGAERLMHDLHEQLNQTSPHVAELIKLPVREDKLSDLMDAYERFSSLDLLHFDAVISSKYPAWMVNHPRHVVYMMHPLRGLYEMYGAFGQPEEVPAVPEIAALLDLLSGPRASPDAIVAAFRAAREDLGHDHPLMIFPGPLARRLVRRLDCIALSSDRVVGHLAISRTVARRPGYFPPGVDVVVAIPPSGLRGCHSESFQHFFTASRLDGPKRLDLLIEAYRLVKTNMRLTIGGTGPERTKLAQLAEADPRVTITGFLSEHELIANYAKARAVPFIPIDEDLGLVTLEAQMSGKPVITCTDSGGSAELVESGVDGFVVEPNRHALANGLQALADDEELARSMGNAARTSAERHTWPAVVDALLRGLDTTRPGSPRGHHPGAHGPAPQIVALSTYPIEPMIGGGAIRARHLYSRLAEQVEVSLVTIGEPASSPSAQRLGPQLTQMTIPRSAQHTRLESQLGLRMPVPIGDVAASLYGVENDDLLGAIRKATERADLAVLTHPYMLPLLQAVRPRLPYALDSHNAEYQLKACAYPDDQLGRELSDVVRTVEQQAVRGAELITFCTAPDQEALLRLGPTMAEWLRVPNGADTRSTRFVTGADRRDRRDRLLARLGRPDHAHIAVFVGSAHPPNVAAAQRIIRLAPDVPQVLFLLVGGHADELDHEDVPENVVMAGPVAEPMLQAILHAADLGLNPMEHGSGSNLKVAEAFAAGLPMITTPVGARGFDVLHGDELLISLVDDFAEVIRGALADPAGCDALANAARRMAEQELDWDVLGDRFAERVFSLRSELIHGHGSYAMK